MSDTDLLATFEHRRGNPVLDRPAALLNLRNQGVPGNAIASGDLARWHATDRIVTVLAVDHATGEVAIWAGGPRQEIVNGHDLTVTQPQHFHAPADDFLEGMTLDEARAALVPLASDNGRYPQYGRDYFAGWVFGRARRNIKHRGEVILTRGQRFLLRQHTPEQRGEVPAPGWCVAYITRPWLPGGRSIEIDLRHVDVERREYAQVVVDTLRANQQL